MPAKPAAIAAVLTERSDDPRAAPFYRALETLGAKVADEALLALRLVLAGATADDDAIRTIRDLRTRARSGDAGARTAYFAMVGGDMGARGT
jgi:hypothetical protein